MDPHTQRAEAERWLGIAAKLLTARDFLGSRTFAIRARDADPNNPVSDQILAVVDTVLAGEKRVNSSQQPDWYSILQLPRLIRDADLIADHYRRLVMCLNPERNRFPFADYALQLVMDAWSVLSDPNKKWLFDNELALYLQQGEPIVATTTAAPTASLQQPLPAASVSAGGGGGGGGSGGGQLNTFQFFQPPPQPAVQQQQQQQMWQQNDQREFISLQSQPQQQQQQIPAQWQMSGAGGGGSAGERNKGILNGIGGLAGGGATAGATITSPIRPVVRGVPQGPPSQTPVSMARVEPTTSVRGDGAAGGAAGYGSVNTIPTATATATFFDNSSSNDRINNDRINVNNDNDGNINGVAVGYTTEDVDDEINVADVEEVECFWTACPYCFYIFEYQKMYQDCTLRCQNCRRGFQAVQIPNPPSISDANNGGGGGGSGGGGGKEGKEKGKSSFCSWGFFPLGFSMMAWRRKNQNGNLNGSSNWAPFTPMFTRPVGDGGEGFKWFDNANGNAHVGPKNHLRKNSSWVYFDDDDALVNASGPSDNDLSDGDWRTMKSKIKKRRKVTFTGAKRGRPRKDDVYRSMTLDVASGGRVSLGGDPHQVVIALTAGEKSNARKTVSAAIARKLNRKSVKDVKRLDLNVEFNNEGEEHAPTVSAVHRDEDGIENMFFDGLDEFLSTLPILNVGGDDKAKPS